MRALVLSSVFPNGQRPTFGLFVAERVRHVSARCDVLVVAPVPWFPFNQWIRGRTRVGLASVEAQDGLTVQHPRFFSLPRIGKSLDGILYYLSLLPMIARLQQQFPFDLIDAHFAYPDGLAAVLLGKTFRRPVTITIRGDEVRLCRYALRRPQLRFALRSAHVIAVSESLRGVAAALRVDPCRVRVIPNGVDSSLFHPRDRGLARERLGLSRNRVILLGVGSMIERKGHHRVIDILPEIVSRHPDVLYVALGEDVRGESYRQTIESLVRDRRMEDHVRFVPACSHAEIPWWMAAADLFCLATRSEGCCNAILEAQACGLPVVTTRVGGNAEFVRDREDGFLVPFWDGSAFASAILEALDHPWDPSSIAARGQARTWSDTARDVIEEFRLAIASPSTSCDRL